jgi:hypothetical protein
MHLKITQLAISFEIRFWFSHKSSPNWRIFIPRGALEQKRALLCFLLPPVASLRFAFHQTKHFIKLCAAWGRKSGVAQLYWQWKNVRLA